MTTMNDLERTWASAGGGTGVNGSNNMLGSGRRRHGASTRTREEVDNGMLAPGVHGPQAGQDGWTGWRC
jgi:hypothetical protein